MIITDKPKLVQTLKVFWSLWDKKHPDEGIVRYSLEDFHTFITEKGKYVGITDDFDDLCFWYSVANLNEDKLMNKTLTVDNVEVPIENTFRANYTRVEWQKVQEFFEKNITTYLSRRELKDNFWFLNHEDYIDTTEFRYTHNDFIEGGDLDSEDIEISEITPQQKESVDNYMTNLSEGELDYMVKKLLGNHLHYRSK